MESSEYQQITLNFYEIITFTNKNQVAMCFKSHSILLIYGKLKRKRLAVFVLNQNVDINMILMLFGLMAY